MEKISEIISGVKKIIRAVDIYSNRLKEKYGLNSSQLTCLDQLNRHGTMQLSEIGKKVNLSPSTLTTVIDQLESRLLVKRVRSDKDRRVIKIEITKNGIEILDKAPTLLHKKLEDELKTLNSTQQEQILNALNTLTGAIEAEDLNGSPILATGEPDAIHLDNEFKIKEN